MANYVNSQPGINAANTNNQDYSVVPINVFFQRGETAAMMAAPVSISGASTDQPSNAPYDFVILPGQLFGKITTGAQAAKYGTSVPGLLKSAALSGATSITTDLNTAAEIVRRFGTSGTFNLTGPPTSGGVVATNLVTYSAVNTTTTGVITCSALAAAYIATSLIQPTDGSQTIQTVFAGQYPIKVKDVYNVVRTDITCPSLIASAGSAILEDGYILQFGTATISDVSLAAYIRAALSAGIPGIAFRSMQNT